MKSKIALPIVGARLNYSHPLSQGLVGCYLLNEGGGTKAFNSSINANNIGTLTNGAVYQIKQRGQCVSLNGTSHYIGLGTTTTLDIPSAVTISAWVNTSTVAIGTRQIVCNSNTAGSLVQWNLEINRTTGGSVKMLANSAGVAVTSATNLVANTWYHLVGTRTGTAGSWTYSLYINGQKDATATVTGNPNPHQIDAIGCGGTGSFQLFSGFIQDVKLYNRCLSETEVRQLYLTPYAMFMK